MAVAFAVNPNPAKALNSATVTVTGMANNTPYVAAYYLPGGGPVYTTSFVSDGAGKATLTIVPPLPGGAYTLDITLTTVTKVATGSLVVVGTG
jgi:hypothetical protein